MKMAWSVGLVALGTLGGCVLGNYRVVRRAADGGELALDGEQQEAHQRAAKYMAWVCQGPYEILEEG